MSEEQLNEVNSDATDQKDPLAKEAPRMPLNYRSFVEGRNFGEYQKCALDLADLLSSPDLLVSGEEYEAKEKANARQQVFDNFCAICVKAGVPTPPLEADLYLPFVPVESDSSEIAPRIKKILDMKEFVEKQTEASDNAEAKRITGILTDFMVLFAERFEGRYGGTHEDIHIQDIVSLLNKKLVDAGLEPVRPDYAQLKIHTGMEEKGPEKLTRLLIVDDSFKEIVNSVLRVAGWSNIAIDYYLHKRKYESLDENGKAKKLADLTEVLFAKSPDVILMDQGIDGDFDGSDILHAMKKDPRSKGLKYVANTGGSDDELVAEGAYSNFDKGKNLKGLRMAIGS